MNLSSILTNTASNSNSSGSIPTDVYNKVSKIMQSQNSAAPKINAALSADKTTLSGLGQLQNALATFQRVAQSLTGSGLDLSASSSAKEVLTASTSSRSLAGSYAIQVSQLAQSQTLRSQTLPSADGALGSGAPAKLSFTFGTTAGNTFSTNTAESSTRTVNIPSGTHTLQGLAAAINDARIGVAAKVVPSGTGFSLELTSPSGAASSMRIGVSGDQALQDLLAHNPAGGKNLGQIAAAQNAKLTINGIALESTTNTVTGAVPGTTLSLSGTGASKLDIAQGSAQLQQNVTNLVQAFNTLNARLNALQAGELKNDGAASHVHEQLARILFSGAGGAAGISSQSLAKIGITVQTNGDLAVDAGKLQNAISADSTTITKLFTNGGKGLADTLASQIQAMVGPSGSLPRKANAINQEIATLSAKKTSLEKALTAQANALVKYFSQQGTDAAGQTGRGSSLMDMLSQ